MDAVIDVWMQHPTHRFVKQPIFASLLRWLGAEELPEVPLEFTIGAMEAAGVVKGMLAAWCGPQGWLIDHDEVAAAARTCPERLIPIASANLYQPMAAVRELRRRVKEHGFRGLRIVPWLWDLPPDDRRYYPLYAECCELDIPFCTQVGHTGPLCPSEPGRPIPYLDRVALEFPDLKIIAGHVGYPWTQEIISLAMKYPNVYIDTSAYKVKRLPKELVEYMGRHGRKKVMFGTNYPMLTAQACLDGIEDLCLDEEARRCFLHDNAAQVFKLTS